MPLWRRRRRRWDAGSAATAFESAQKQDEKLEAKSENKSERKDRTGAVKRAERAERDRGAASERAEEQRGNSLLSSFGKSRRILKQRLGS